MESFFFSRKHLIHLLNFSHSYHTPYPTTVVTKKSLGLKAGWCMDGENSVTITKHHGFIPSDELIPKTNQVPCNYVLKAEDAQTFSVVLWEIGVKKETLKDESEVEDEKSALNHFGKHEAFPKQPLNSFNSNNQSTCRKLFRIRDVISRENDVSICSLGRRKKKLVYTSQSNVIEITSNDVTHFSPNFLIQFFGKFMLFFI